MDRIDVLRLFLRIGARGSFSAAAKDLKIKQSTASKWLADLEAEFGTALVARTTRAVHLTVAGQRLLARAAEVVAAFDELKGDMQGEGQEPAGRVRISAPVVFGRLFLVPALGAFVARHARVSLEVVLNDRYVNLVEEGFDLAVRVGVPADTSARGRKLAEGRRVLVASPAYLQRHARPQEPKDLKRHECLVHGEENAPTIWRFAAPSGAEIPIAVRGRLAVNNSEAVLALTRQGLGIALLAEWLVADDVAAGRLVPLLEGFDPPPAPIYVLSPPGRFTSAAARALSDHLADALAPRLLGASTLNPP
jgi:DNA-binding transcriptional LysR family regulator